MAGAGLRDVHVLVREPSRAAGVLDAAGRLGLEPVVARLDDRAVADVLAKAALVVCTLPATAADVLVPVVRSLTVTGVLLDVVYEPWPTALGAAWRVAGGPIATGESMLLHQAAAQVRLMTGLEPPVAAMRAGMAAERAARVRLTG
jgi:shikimate dehydrogenase